MDLEKFDNYILDVDGTLYSQKKLRIRMLLRLIIYYGLRPFKIKELFALIYFRKLREDPLYKNESIDKLYILIKKKTNLDVFITEKVIQKWMFTSPLNILKKYAYDDVIDFINEQHKIGKKIIIYSDYPAKDKLNKLEIEFDNIFASGEDGIIEQKPSLNAMKKILKDTDIDINSTLYVGDRNDRDKISADLVGIKYCDIKKFKKKI